MIEVEDKDPLNPDHFAVESYGRSQVMVTSDNGEAYIHKDTWPALKEAIETTFKQMDAKPLIQTGDRDKVYKILETAMPLMRGGPRLSELCDYLERGYV